MILFRLLCVFSELSIMSVHDFCNQERNAKRKIV